MLTTGDLCSTNLKQIASLYRKISITSSDPCSPHYIAIAVSNITVIILLTPLGLHTSDVSIILQLTDTSIASYITIGCKFIYTHSMVAAIFCFACMHGHDKTIYSHNSVMQQLAS